MLLVGITCGSALRRSVERANALSHVQSQCVAACCIERRSCNACSIIAYTVVGSDVRMAQLPTDLHDTSIKGRDQAPSSYTGLLRVIKPASASPLPLNTSTTLTNSLKPQNLNPQTAATTGPTPSPTNNGRTLDRHRQILQRSRGYSFINH